MKHIVLSIIIMALVGCNKKASSSIVEVQTALPKYEASQELFIPVEDTVKIAGTLEYSTDEKLVIIIAGSGPTDRDCNSAMGSKTDAFKKLAAFLTEKSISSFRYDKRGIGKSTKVDETGMTLNTFAEDASSIASHFKKDFQKIILLGHSEGALLGSMIAERNHVDAFISVSGTSISFDKILLDQMAKYPKIMPELEKHINEIKAGQELSEVHPIIKSMFRASIIPFLSSAFKIDPYEEMSKVTKPSLIVGGKCDLQVPPNHAESLKASNKNSELLVIENMGHVLANLEEDCGNAQVAYNAPEMELNPSFAEGVYNFIRKL